MVWDRFRDWAFGVRVTSGAGKVEPRRCPGHLGTLGHVGHLATLGQGKRTKMTPPPPVHLGHLGSPPNGPRWSR